MQLLFCPLFSGSSGNSVYVGTENSGVLVDAGVSCSRILSELNQIGLSANAIKAILITHEHFDHISGAGILSRKLDLPIYATEGTWRSMGDKLGEIAPKNMFLVDSGRDFYLGGMNIAPFKLPHDASEPCGYSFYSGDLKASIATDIGCVKDGWLKAVEDSDILLLESNYDLDMLKAGRYPYSLKTRIMGKKGHLSNDDCASAAVKLACGRVKNIILGHLSKENNFPELARETTASALRAEGCDPERDIILSLANRDRNSGVFSLKSGDFALAQI